MCIQLRLRVVYIYSLAFYVRYIRIISDMSPYFGKSIARTNRILTNLLFVRHFEIDQNQGVPL